MSQSGSGQSVSVDSTESQSGSTTTTTTKPKIDFGKKHRKVVRILTVVAYIISVSTAAVLLSAYYVFLWNPSTSKQKGSSSDPPTTMALARQITVNGHDYDHDLSYMNTINDEMILPSQSVIKATHDDMGDKLLESKNEFPQIPTPPSLILQNLLTTSIPLSLLPISSSSSSLSSPSPSISPSNTYIPPTTRTTQSILLTTPSLTNSNKTVTHLLSKDEGMNAIVVDS